MNRSVEATGKDELILWPSSSSMQGTKLTTSEQVYYQLKEGIARAQFHPGARLVVRDLAARFHVSRTPVVEAIRRLERDGLVTSVPKWGASVKDWTWEEIEEAMIMRRALEGEAARQFVMRALPEDKWQLVRLNDRFKSCAGKAESTRCDTADIDLHLHIARSTRLQRLFDLMQTSSLEITCIIGLTIKQSNAGLEELICHRNAESAGCHDVLVQKLLGKDPEAAHAEMVRDLDDNLKLIGKLRRVQNSNPRGLGMASH